MVQCSHSSRMESAHFPFAFIFNVGAAQSDVDDPPTKSMTMEPAAAKPAERQLGPFQFRTKIVWFNLLGFLAMHLIGVYGIYMAAYKFFTNWEIGTVIWMGVLVFLGGEGITMGAHRLWSHKSYKARLPMQLLLMTFQTLAGQNCLYIWARDHRQHHKYTDTDADPHNATRGFFFSHIGWLMMKKHPEVLAKGHTVDMSDLEANPLVMFQKKYYKPLYVVAAMIIPVLVPVYLWNEDLYYSFIFNFFSRYVVLLNITWSVNSVAHIFGTRPYDQNMLPVESLFVAFISIGEGWHNYHHAFPWDYKAGEWGKGLNTTRKIIEFFHRIGWAYDLREASQNVVNAKAKRLGDGTHVPAGDPDSQTAFNPLTVVTQDDESDSDETSHVRESVSNDLLMPSSESFSKPAIAESSPRRRTAMTNHG